MIQELSIKIKDGGLTHTISIDTDIDGNLPYDIACAIEEVVHLTNANPEHIVEHLAGIYGMKEQPIEIEKVDYVTWHKPNSTPNIKEPIYVVFEDKNEKPFVINDIIDDDQWRLLVCDRNPYQWCYLNELLKEGYKI